MKKVITMYIHFIRLLKKQCYYNVITFFILFAFSLLFHTSGYAFELISPVQEGSLVYGKLDVGERIRYQGEEIIPTTYRAFVFALPQDAPDQIELILTRSDGREENLSFKVRRRKWNEEYISGLPPQKVNPSPVDQDRIRGENRQVGLARSIFSRHAFPVCFEPPVKDYNRISSHFGSRRILNGQKKAGHSGTDYAAPIGTNVYAPAVGIVRFVHDDLFYTGKTILIDHGYGIYSSYSHLSQINVKKNQKVDTKTLLGKVGTTGRSTGPHLHFVLSWKNVRVDPEAMIQQHPCAQRTPQKGISKENNKSENN